MASYSLTVETSANLQQMAQEAKQSFLNIQERLNEGNSSATILV